MTALRARDVSNMLRMICALRRTFQTDCRCSSFVSAAVQIAWQRQRTEVGFEMEARANYRLSPGDTIRQGEVECIIATAVEPRTATVGTRVTTGETGQGAWTGH